MNIPQQLTVDEASRLAVTATAADLEDWARSAATHGQVELADLVAVLDLMRADSIPQAVTAPALAAS